MTRHTFLVTSAINTKLGVFSSDDRLRQTLATVASINRRAPGSNIILLEMGAEPITELQWVALSDSVDYLIELSDTETKSLYDRTDNWDVIKSYTELHCFAKALRLIGGSDEFDIDKSGRIFKVSGRYLLNEDFDIDSHTVGNKIVFMRRKNSQFDPAITGGVSNQYMSRCWSFPAADIATIAKQFESMKRCMTQIVVDGGYLDIEHLLFLYTDPEKVMELDVIGVEGNLGPNGILVKE